LARDASWQAGRKAYVCAVVGGNLNKCMYVYKMSETLVTPRVNYVLSPLGAMHNTCSIEAHLSQYW